MTNRTESPIEKLRRGLLIRWWALWPIAVGLTLYPVSNRLLRIATLVAVLLIWTGALWFFWRTKWLRMVCISVPVLISTFAVLPGHGIDRVALKEDYINSLQSFEGCRYVWGGENRFGIDCSGLVRAGLINASLRESVQTLNPAMLRFALNLWWHDCSAKALGKGHREQTVCITNALAINALGQAPLQPGDLAVTEDGVHVLAFLGNNRWIEADPGAKSVLIATVPSTNEWFETPVNIIRWRILDDSREQLSRNDH